MSYEPGSYLKELVKEHFAGRHKDNWDGNCPTCLKQDDSEDDSEETHFFAMEVATELENHLAAHDRGEHEEKREALCIECVHPDSV